MTANPEISLESTDPGYSLHGDAVIANATALWAALDRLPVQNNLQLDLSHLAKIDTAGAYALIHVEMRARESGHELEMTGLTPATQRLLARVKASLPDTQNPRPHKPSLSDRLENLGSSVSGAVRTGFEALGIFGLFLVRLAQSILRPGQFRGTSLVHHIQDVGLRAVPIVALMSFLIGVVLAFQGSTQLRQFGAEVFVVDLIAISILRELGILLTAIIVAGRTASGFTAAIGSMKINEEIDAMRTLAIDPGAALIVPRILALVISLPILAIIANVAGLLGGAMMSWIELGISPSMFQVRLLDGTDIRHVWVGIVKAPVFALIIGVIGCWAGLRVERDAESLGRMTSAAVVAAIFSVIVADAIFSIFFASIGV